MFRSFNCCILKKSTIVHIYVNIFRVFFILLPLCDSLSIEDRVQAPSKLQHVHKRQGFEDYRMCAANFEIHQDKIIRTEESKRLGAKYLNGKDVTSKDECVKFCCDTLNCNVFVLEEKVFNQQSGTCYLFECGTPESFKCKFTRHLNYSSAVLIVNRPQIQLEDEIQYTQHERELTSLRNNENEFNNSKNCRHNQRTNVAVDDPVMKDSKDSTKLLEDGVEDTFKRSGKCSRYQFECRTSGECIAIYNACDGIPQCADKSDEDVELGCPTSAPPVLPKKGEDVRVPGNIANAEPAFKQSVVSSFRDNVPQVPNSVEQSYLLQQQQQLNQQQQFLPLQLPYNQQMNGNQWLPKVNQQPYYDGSPVRSDIPIVNENYPNVLSTNVNAKTQSQNVISAPNYVGGHGGDGSPTGINYFPSRNNDDLIMRQHYGPFRNYNHKPNNVMIPYNTAEFDTMTHNSPYDMPNNGYNGYPAASSANGWHRKYANNSPSNTNSKLLNAKDDKLSKNKIIPEYSYEKVNASMAKNADPVQITNLTITEQESNKLVTDKKIDIFSSNVKNGNIAKTTTTGTISLSESTVPTDTTTVASKKGSQTSEKSDLTSSTNHEEQISHRKLEKDLSADLSDMRAQLLDVSKVYDGYTEQPSGAFVSLTLGICVTAVMVFVVSCRLKVVRKRIRRGGKLPYAHDADFLVNGMYL